MSDTNRYLILHPHPTIPFERNHFGIKLIRGENGCTIPIHRIHTQVGREQITLIATYYLINKGICKHRGVQNPSTRSIASSIIRVINYIQLMINTIKKINPNMIRNFPTTYHTFIPPLH